VDRKEYIKAFLSRSREEVTANKSSSKDTNPPFDPNTCFSNFDISGAFLCIQMQESAKEQTAYASPYGSFEKTTSRIQFMQWASPLLPTC
jgi:hypothetical protein